MGKGSVMEIAPVTRSVVVDVPPEKAFDVFTLQIGSWWPTQTYSIGDDKVTEVVFDAEGGRIYERWADGTTCDWAKILVLEAPKRLVLAWSPTTEPSIPTEVEVRFTPVGTGTRVDLEHRGWERLAHGEKARVGYDSGWPGVLALYQAAANT